MIDSIGIDDYFILHEAAIYRVEELLDSGSLHYTTALMQFEEFVVDENVISRQIFTPSIFLHVDWFNTSQISKKWRKLTPIELLAFQSDE